MPTKTDSVSVWAVVDGNFCTDLIFSDQAFIDSYVKSKHQAVVNASDLLPDYQVKIGDVYDPKSKKFSHPT